MGAADISSTGSEFHSFLYADIGRDQEGVTLTVLSALARRDFDPWAEASRLSQLPQKTAAAQILDLLDALPQRTLSGLDSAAVAGRLSALLPRGPTSTLAAKLPAGAKGAQNPAAAVAFNWRFLFLYFCLMLLMNWLLAVSNAPPPAAAASDSATGAVQKPSDTPPVSKGPGAVARNQEP